MLVIVAQALFFFLPAYVANAMPVIFAKLGWLKFLDFPMDFNKKMHGEKIFGSHKTFRGIVAGIIGGIFITELQYFLYQYIPQSRWLFLFHYENPEIFWFGFWIGFGALAGDLVKSFIKRRIHIEEGKVFFPFDQLDFILGAILVSAFFYLPPRIYLYIAIGFTPLLHFLANVVAYFLGWKKVWW